MPEIDVKLSQITPSASDATSGTQIVSVQGGATDNLFSLQQINNGPFFSTVSNGIGGAVARSAAGRFSDVINVKDFGAVGNNITDDSNAINAAIAAAATLGGVAASQKGCTVFFPAGTYKVTKPLVNNVAQTNVALEGVSFESSIIVGTVVPSPTQSGFTIDVNDGTGIAHGGDNLGPHYLGNIERIENIRVRNTYIPTRVWPANVITAGSWSNGTGAGLFTLTTTTAHTVLPGQYFTISGCSPSGYNGNYIAQTGTTGSTLVGSKTWIPSLVAPNANPGAFVSGGTLVAASPLGFDPTVGAIRFNDSEYGTIKHCHVDGFNGIVAFNNVYTQLYSNVSMSGFANQPGSVAFNTSAVLVACNVLGYWRGVQSCAAGPQIFGVRVEVCRDAIVVGVSPYDGVTSDIVQGFNVVGMQIERCERGIVMHSATVGLIGNCLLTGVIGIPHTANISGTGALATVNLITTSGQPTLDALDWITNGTTRLVKISSAGYGNGTVWVTGTRTSNTQFTFPSTGTATSTCTFSFQIIASLVLDGSVKTITFTNINSSVATGDLTTANFDLSGATALTRNTMISCRGPDTTPQWKMPTAVNKAGVTYFNCDQPAGSTLDSAGLQSGMNFADLPGQAGVLQPGPIEGQTYDIVNCNAATFLAAAAGGGAGATAHRRVRYNAATPGWQVIG